MELMINSVDKYLDNLRFVLLEAEESRDKGRYFDLAHSQVELAALASRKYHGADVEVLETEELEK